MKKQGIAEQNGNPTLESLLTETSRRNTDMVAEIILKKPDLFGEIMEIFLKNEEPVSRRAAWIADIISETKPELLIPYLELIIDRLPCFSHDGMKRESLRMLSRSPFPEGKTGYLTSLCFKWLTSAKETAAVKVYSMDILYRLSQIEPDLKQELADSIEWRMQEETPGFKSHGMKLLRRLRREMRNR